MKQKVCELCRRPWTEADSLGSRLRYYRIIRGYTMQSLADKAGVSKGYVSSLENNKAQPTVRKLITVCKALEINPGSLLDWSEGE